MEKLKTALNFSHKFAKLYAVQYLKMLIKPCLVGLLGFIFLPLMFVNPIFAIFAIVVTLPCLFYSFWRGFCVTYLLNYASLNLVQDNAIVELKSFEAPFRAVEKDFIKYISFCAVVTLICFLPCFLIASKSITKFDVLNPVGIISALLGMFVALGVITILLAPFINFFTQAYFFKKDNENYFNLLINCYKKLDKEGIIIALVIVILPTILTSINAIFTPLLLVLNLYFYSINTYWYSSKNS